MPWVEWVPSDLNKLLKRQVSHRFCLEGEEGPDWMGYSLRVPVSAAGDDLASKMSGGEEVLESNEGLFVNNAGENACVQLDWSFLAYDGDMILVVKCRVHDRAR